MATIKLKPCPFCGSPGELYQFKESQLWIVQCTNSRYCTCEYGQSKSKSYAARLWNRRRYINEAASTIHNNEYIK